jgi:hypothetical protein
MSKVAELQSQLQKASARSPRAAKLSPPEPVVPAPATALSASYKAPSRDGKTHVGAYLPIDFKRSLRLVQAQTGEDTQTLIARALNDLFRAHNVPVIDQF